MSKITDEIADQLRRHFLAGGRFEGLYDPPSTDGLEEVVPGGVWQCLVYPVGSATARFMRVYGLGEDNADLMTVHWRNEVRALMRLSARRHPNLPVMRDAGILGDDALGYLVIDDPGDSIVSDHPILPRLRSDRARTLREFLSLVEAVSLLHRDGMVHRTITPDSVCARRVADAPLVLDGFQMSAFVSTWLRGRGAVEDWTPGSFLPSIGWSRVFLPPERLAPLFGGRTRRLEGYGADVFSMGMLGAWWFLGAQHFANADSVFDKDVYDEQRHQELVGGLQSALRGSDLPPALRRLLVQMTEFSNRVPSAVVAYEALCKMYGAVLAKMEESEGESDREPARIYYLLESVERLYDDGLAASHPKELEFEEYNDLIERDLADGLITWCDDGFRRWRTRSNPDAEKARVVLMGKHYCYFCQYLDQGQDGEDRRVLVVKFLLQNHRAAELRRLQLQRAAPPLSASYFTPGTSRTRPVPKSAPSWYPLVESVRSSQATDASTPIERAGRWLLGLDAGRALAGTFPTEVLEEQLGTVTVRATARDFDDSPADDESVAFAELWLRVRKRPAMGHYFEELHESAIENERLQYFEVLAAPGDTKSIAQLRFQRTLDPDTARFEINEKRGEIPERPWIRPEDVAGRVVRQRQHNALTVAGENFQLTTQLKAPRAIAIHTEAEFADAAEDVSDDDTRVLIRKMLRAWPAFVVQGPPGTGKTFLAAHFIAEFLLRDPFARILISAQSHDAVDNLLEQVEDILSGFRDESRGPGSAILLRIATDSTVESLSERGKRHLPAQVLLSVIQGIGTAPALDPGPLRRLQKQWRRMADKKRLDIDIGQRIHRAASITCVSSNSATSWNLRAPYEAGSFDLVVLEEAARGWLTEMLVPLVHANRWLLIGDQKQLPAHAATEVTRALRIDVEDNITGAATDRPASAELMPYLQWFGSLFEAPVQPRGRQIDPREVLRVQRRMHPDIGRLVSRVFYGDKLKSHSSTKRRHGLKGVPFFKNTAFLWVDTAPLGEDAREHGLTNYCECQILRMLIEDRVGTFPEHQPTIPSVHVLTPYRAQRKKLMQVIKGLPEEAFATVHGFQGRQAEVVFVSLTRNNTFDAPGRALGFLQAPEITNVMFSRARRLLVVVGSLDHFSRFPSTHWQEVVAYVRGDSRFYFDPTGPQMRFRATWRKQ